MARGWYSMG